MNLYGKEYDNDKLPQEIEKDCGCIVVKDTAPNRFGHSRSSATSAVTWFIEND